MPQEKLRIARIRIGAYDIDLQRLNMVLGLVRTRDGALAYIEEADGHATLYRKRNGNLNLHKTTHSTGEHVDVLEIDPAALERRIAPGSHWRRALGKRVLQAFRNGLVTGPASLEARGIDLLFPLPTEQGQLAICADGETLDASVMSPVGIDAPWQGSGTAWLAYGWGRSVGVIYRFSSSNEDYVTFIPSRELEVLQQLWLHLVAGYEVTI